MEDNILDAALEYSRKGFSVIPVRENKKPFIDWGRHQTKKADTDQIKRWWGERYPSANVAIVTGAISGLTVIDADSEEGKQAIEEQLPDNLLIPIAKTPHGYHYYFKYEKGQRNTTRFITDCDIRSEGGYIIAPPSTGYEWQVELDRELPAAPSPLSKIISSLYRGANICQHDANICQHVPTNANIVFEKGSRDNSLFHVANCLAKGGMPTREIEQLLSLIATKICNPPFPVKEIPVKIQSALKRLENENRNLTQEVRELICQQSANISLTFAYNCLHLPTRQEKKKVQTIFSRLVKEGLLERSTTQAGVYRIIEKNHEVVDLDQIEDLDSIDIRLPFGIEQFIEVMPKDLICFAGQPNSGKTALLLESLRLNMDRHRCWYFSTEMSRYNAKKRIAKHKECTKWNFKFSDDVPNYYDILRPDDFNFIDYVEEAQGEYYMIPSILAGIQKRLKNGVAFVALQKKRGAEWGVGGQMTVAKPALFCAIDVEPPGARIKIVKAKNYRDINPTGWTRKFKIVNGITIYSAGDWE